MKKITFVSFCVDIDRGSETVPEDIRRDINLYTQGMNENISSVLPLVVYTSETNINIGKHRNKENFRIYDFNKDSIINDFPNFDLYKNTYDTISKDKIESSLYLYNPLVVLKIKKIIDVIEENPFNSDYFFWIDSYFQRGINDIGFFNNEQIHNECCDNIKNIINDKFLIFNSHDRPFGFFWGGSKIAIQNVYLNYFSTYFESFPNKLLTEELIFKKLIEKSPDIFDIQNIIHYGGRYKQAVVDYLKLK
jgi:hypothetical protein